LKDVRTAKGKSSSDTRRAVRGREKESQLKRRRYRLVFLVLFAAGLTAGVIQTCTGGAIFCVGCEMVGIAHSLVTNGVYGNPFVVFHHTGPTAANPPMYPLFLALLLKVFNNWHWVVIAAIASNIAANALTAAWLPRVSLAFYGDLWPGILGAILWLAAAPLDVSWDESFTMAGLLLFCLSTSSRLWRDSPFLSALLAGGIAGVVFLLNPSSLLVFSPWVVYLIVRRESTLRQGGILFATLTLIISVWAGRNYLRLGAFVVRTNLGMTLYASDIDCAEPSLAAEEANGCYNLHHPNRSAREAQLLLTLGEVEYDRRRTADAESWIRTHQSRFWTLAFQRFLQFWLPPLDSQHPPLNTWAIRVATVLSIPGLLVMIYRREPVTWFVLTVLFLYPLLYYAVVSSERYRYPVFWLSLLAAGYFVWQSYSYLSERLISKEARSDSSTHKQSRPEPLRS
jgi:hypothetical protein